MLYEKDGVVYNEGQIRELHYNISFTQKTFGDMGYKPYYEVPQARVHSFEETCNILKGVVQNYLDTVAKTYNYDSILTACSYASGPNKYRDEGLSFLYWRSEVWNAYTLIEKDIELNVRSVPNETELIQELPKYTPL